MTTDPERRLTRDDIIRHVERRTPAQRKRARIENREADKTAYPRIVEWLVGVSDRFRRWYVERTLAGDTVVHKMDGRPATTAREIAERNALARKILQLPKRRQAEETARIARANGVRPRTVRDWIARVRKKGR
jgi:hypothetical protein